MATTTPTTENGSQDNWRKLVGLTSIGCLLGITILIIIGMRIINRFLHMNTSQVSDNEMDYYSGQDRPPAYYDIVYESQGGINIISPPSYTEALDMILTDHKQIQSTIPSP